MNFSYSSPFSFYRALASCLVILFCCQLSLLSPRSHSASLSSFDSLQAASLCQEAERLFQEGNELYATDSQLAMENWRQAALCYERLRQEGNWQNGELYYNLGNTYFRLGDLGRAVLNYRRAQQLMPNDVNLHRNLAFVKSRCRNQIAEAEQTKVLKTIFFWHYDLPPAWRENIFFLAFACVWTLAGWRLWRPSANWPKWAMFITVAIAAAMAASLLGDEWNKRKNPAGVIINEDVIARKGDSESYQPSFTEPLQPGTEFVLKNKRPKWLEITLPDKQNCWIPEKDAEMVNQIKK